MAVDIYASAIHKWSTGKINLINLDIHKGKKEMVKNPHDSAMIDYFFWSVNSIHQNHIISSSLVGIN